MNYKRYYCGIFIVAILIEIYCRVYLSIIQINLNTFFSEFSSLVILNFDNDITLQEKLKT